MQAKSAADGIDLNARRTDTLTFLHLPRFSAAIIAVCAIALSGCAGSPVNHGNRTSRATTASRTQPNPHEVRRPVSFTQVKQGGGVIVSSVQDTGQPVNTDNPALLRAAIRAHYARFVRLHFPPMAGMSDGYGAALVNEPAEWTCHNESSGVGATMIHFRACSVPIGKMLIGDVHITGSGTDGVAHFQCTFQRNDIGKSLGAESIAPGWQHSPDTWNHVFAFGKTANCEAPAPNGEVHWPS